MSSIWDVLGACVGSGLASGLVLSAFNLSQGPVKLVGALLCRLGAKDAEGMDTVDGLSMFLAGRGYNRWAYLVLCPICLGTRVAFTVTLGVLWSTGLPLVSIWWSGLCSSGIALVFYLVVRRLMSLDDVRVPGSY